MVEDTTEKAEADSSVFDDEETRLFYLSLPNLRAMVPAVLLGEAATSDSTPGEEPQADETSGNEPETQSSPVWVCCKTWIILVVKSVLCLYFCYNVGAGL